MAEFEELAIKVKAPDEATKKNIENIKQGFREITSGEQAEGFKSIGRQMHDLEGTIKSLVESAGSGDAFKAIGSLTASLGKAGPIGLAIAGISELINATINFATVQARGLVALADQARRIRVHPAQLQAELEVARRATPEIGDQQFFNIVQTLHERTTEIRERNLPEMREKFLKGTIDPEIIALKQSLINQIVAAPQAEQLNLAIEGARQIEELFVKRKMPGVGTLEAEDWIRGWTGSIDLLRVRDKFAQVSEEDKALMDKMVVTSQAWVVMMAGISTNFESIIRLVTVNVMNDPVIGGILKTIGAGAQAEAELLEEERLGKKPEMPWWWGPKRRPNVVGESVAPGISGLLRWIYRTYQILQRGDQQQGGGAGTATPQLLLGGIADKQLGQTEELTAQFRRLNALLSGEEKPIQRLPLHNQPMGGAGGESNPLNLAPGTTQPGGGATSEAVPLLRPWQAGDPSRGTYTVKGVTKQYPILSAAATPLPPLPGDPTYSGVTQGKGVATYFGYHPTWGVDPSDPRGSSALRVPERYQGISLSTGTSGELGTSGQTLGQWANLTDPRTGLTSVRQQTDVGPGVRTQKIVDIGAESAIQMGYPTRKNFEAMQERVEKGELQPWEVRQAGFGTYGRPGLEGTDITAPMVKGVEPTTTTQNIRELDTGKLIDPRLVGGQRGTTSGGIDITYGGGSGAFDVGGLYDEGRSRGELGESPTPSLLQGQQRGPAARPLTMLAADESDESVRRGVRPDRLSGRAVGLLDMDESDRINLDRGLANEDQIDASGNLDVNVKAPAGTEVRADGDGMFKGNVSLQRQMELPRAM
jgi:hypothetical protein